MPHSAARLWNQSPGLDDAIQVLNILPQVCATIPYNLLDLDPPYNQKYERFSKVSHPSPNQLSFGTRRVAMRQGKAAARWYIGSPRTSRAASGKKKYSNVPGFIPQHLRTSKWAELRGRQNPAEPDKLLDGHRDGKALSPQPKCWNFSPLPFQHEASRRGMLQGLP